MLPTLNLQKTMIFFRSAKSIFADFFKIPSYGFFKTATVTYETKTSKHGRHLLAIASYHL